MSAPFISIYLADRCVGFALNEGPKGWRPVDVEGHNAGDPLPSVAECAAVLRELYQHAAADGD